MVVQRRLVGNAHDSRGALVHAVGPDDRRANALVVHDDPQMTAIIEFALETRGFRVRVATSESSAALVLDSHRPDLVVMDTSAVTIDCVALHRVIRRAGALPVIILTEGPHDLAAVIGIGEDAVHRSGVTVGIPRPFHPRDLAERAAALRRPGIPDVDDVVQVGRLRIDQVRLTVTVDRRPLDLPFTEFKLLTHLAVHRGTPQTWRRLLQAVWGAQTLAGGRDVVKSAIYRLRSRLSEVGAADHVITLRGTGYLMPDLPRSER